MFSASADTGPEGRRGQVLGRQVWAKLPTGELCAVDLEDQDHLRGLVAKLATIT